MDVNAQEGFPPPTTLKTKGKGLIFVCFMLSVLYLPLSTIVTHALVWSDDFWAVPNPYVNATTNPPVLPPLGPPEEFHDPLDFCYTTTMKRNKVNFAPVIVVVSAIAFTLVSNEKYDENIIDTRQITIWFPLRLWNTIKQAVPKVAPFTERGTPRSASELDRAYQRLIERDQHPISFLYSGAYILLIPILSGVWQLKSGFRFQERLGNIQIHLPACKTECPFYSLCHFTGQLFIP